MRGKVGNGRTPTLPEQSAKWLCHLLDGNLQHSEMRGVGGGGSGVEGRRQRSCLEHIKFN